MANSNKAVADEKLKQAYELYSKSLIKYCTVRLKEVASATDDCVQNAFLVYYKKVLAGEVVENPKAFLYRTADNMVKRAIAEYYSNAKRTVELEKAEEVAVEQLDEIETDLDYDYLKEVLISNLSEEEQLLYQQKYVKRLSLKEIGEIYNIAPAAVANRTSRLRAKIKALVIPIIEENSKGGSQS